MATVSISNDTHAYLRQVRINGVSGPPRAPCTTDLFVLVSGDGDELSFWEGLAADHLLDASDLHDVYPRLVLVQRIQHDLQENITNVQIYS